MALTESSMAAMPITTSAILPALESFSLRSCLTCALVGSACGAASRLIFGLLLLTAIVGVFLRRSMGTACMPPILTDVVIVSQFPIWDARRA